MLGKMMAGLAGLVLVQAPLAAQQTPAAPQESEAQVQARTRHTYCALLDGLQKRRAALDQQNASAESKQQAATIDGRIARIKELMAAESITTCQA